MMHSIVGFAIYLDTLHNNNGCHDILLNISHNVTIKVNLS